MRNSKPVESKPILGGRLMSAISHEIPGLHNYTIKRNVRRVLDREIRSEGHVRFCPAMFDGEIPMPDDEGDITCVFELVHPNNRKAFIVCSPTKIWRYSGTEDPLYVEDDYVDDDYVDGPLVPWTLIGSGFSESAGRWEAETINGWAFFSNGVDLPVTYRLTDGWVIPAYEMRELGIASVGTISKLSGILMAHDVRQLKESDHLELMAPIDGVQDVAQAGVTKIVGTLAVINSGADGEEGNVITADNDLFNSGAGFVGMEGTVIRMYNGLEVTISTVNSATEAVFVGTADLAEPMQPFFIVDAAVDNNLSVVASVLFPDETPSDLVGRKLWWETGEMREIVSVESDIIKVHDDSPIVSGPVVLENADTYKTVTDATKYDRIQYRNVWPMPDKPTRFGANFDGVVVPTSNVLQLNYPIKSLESTGEEILITGMETGNIVNEVLWNDGYHIHVANNAIKKFYQIIIDDVEAKEQALLTATTTLTSSSSTYQASLESLEAANVALGADPDDADLTKAVSDATAAVDDAFVAMNAAQAAVDAAQADLDKAEEKLVDSEEVQAARSDVEGSIAGSEDIQDDGSGILKAMELRGYLVIYKETSIFIARYTANAAAPFDFQKVEIPRSSALHFRNTVVLVDGMYHLYASLNGFMRFDMTTQVPVEVLELQDCGDLFYGQANPANTERIFSVNNPITNELFICFPSTTQDRMLRFDYDRHAALKPGPTVSSSSATFTAGALITQPGGSELWFVMGGAGGVVYKYGLTGHGPRAMSGTASKTGAVVTSSAPVFQVSDIGKTIKFRDGRRVGIVSYTSTTEVVVAGTGNVNAQPFSIEHACWHFDGEEYTSVIQSGMEPFKQENSEKKLNLYVPLFSSFSPNTEVNVTLRSARNLNEPEDVIEATLLPPETQVPVEMMGNYLGDNIEVEGINNPFELTGRIYNIIKVESQGFTRRGAS